MKPRALLLLVAGAACAVLVAGPVSAHRVVDETCGKTNAHPGSCVFKVPSRVTSVTFDVYGAQGGTGDNEGAFGGLGGRATLTMQVEPGQVFIINVGEQGEDGEDGGGGGTGGNGDASGGSGGGSDGGFTGGGGGGSSDVRTGGGELADRILIGAGGGGGGAGSNGGTGGEGGGPIGGDGETVGDADGGTGATQITPGLGGYAADDGGEGFGGDGGRFHSQGESANCGGCGGGGGGGLYGGGGGGAVDAGNGAGGGGGSGYDGPTRLAFGPSAAHAQFPGVQAGNGKVLVAFAAPPAVNPPTVTPTAPTPPPLADLAVTESVGDGFVGEPLTFRAVGRNLGPSTANDVRLTFGIPTSSPPPVFEYGAASQGSLRLGLRPGPVGDLRGRHAHAGRERDLRGSPHADRRRRPPGLERRRRLHDRARDRGLSHQHGRHRGLGQRSEPRQQPRHRDGVHSRARGPAGSACPQTAGISREAAEAAQAGDTAREAEAR